LTLPNSTKTSILEIARNNGISVGSSNLIYSVVNYVSNAAVYNLDFKTIPDGEDMVIYFLTKGKEGICQHYAAAATVMFRALGIPARYTVGYAKAVKSGTIETVTAMNAHAWVEIYLDGIGWVHLEVTGSSSDGSQGGALGGGSGGSDSGSGGGSGEDNEDQQPDDSDKEYYGTIILSTKSAEKEYDGTPLTCTEYVVHSSELRDGDVLLTDTIVKCPNLTEPKKISNDIKLKVVDANGKDVTSKYKFSYRTLGTLTVVPRTIEITTLGKNKVYDGDALTCEEYTITYGSLVFGDRIRVVDNTPIIYPGLAENVLEIEIFRTVGGEMKDVTDYYIIEYVYGELKVYEE